MATRPERGILTYADYRQLPDDRNRYELFEGLLQVTPSPSTHHQTVVTNLSITVGSHVRTRKLGKILLAPCDVVLSDTTILQPDLLFVARERLAIILPQYVRGAPDLVVEVLSPSTAQRDRQTKQRLYEAYGVANYWLIDPDRHEAEAYVLEEGSYQLVRVSKESEVFRAAPFPDLAIPLDELWA